MRAQELQDYLRSLDGGWVNLNDTVDTFKAGEPQTEIHGIAVGWMSYTWALKRALELDCNVFVTHEPTYYVHRDNDETVFKYPGVQAKRAFIQESHLVILRCHDVWDQYPGLGVADAWAEFLGLQNPIQRESFYRVFDMKGETAHAIARRVAAKTALFGQPTVQLIGRGDAPVTRLALGTGAITPFRHLLDAYHCDMAICSDDGFVYWRDGALATDLEIPIVVVNHAVSEMYAMQQLAAQLAQKFLHVPVHYIPQGSMLQAVSAGD